jgi:PAS domain S-box-containing protein
MNSQQPGKATRKRVGSERRRFLRIASQISSTIGTEFFRSLVKRLAEALGADCVYVGEFAGGPIARVRTLAACVDHDRERSFEFPLPGSMSEEIAMGNSSVYPSGVQELFPSDQLLRELGGQACVGVPLMDSTQQPIGLIAAVYGRPLDNLHFAKSILEIFSPRAAAELERKQTDEALRESEQRHRAFIAQSPDAMWRIEFEVPIATALPAEQQIDKMYQYGYVAECNDATARMFGLETAEQLIGARFGDLEPPSSPRFREDLLSAVRSEYRYTTIETGRLDQAGALRYLLRSHWGIVESGLLQRIWGMSRDITELRRAEMAVAAAEQTLRELLENLHLVAVMLDREELVSFCNEYLLRMSGYQSEDIIGKNWFDLMIPSEDREKLRTAFEFACNGLQSAGHHEGTLLTRDGRRLLIAWDSTILRDSDGRVTGSASIGRDITEYRAIEEQLRHAQKLESIGRLTGGVAHDFNNLLTLILGYTGMLLAHLDPTDPSYIALSEIKQTAEKGAALTQQLLVFSRRQILHPKLLNPNSLVADSQRMLSRIIREDIELKLELEPALALVCADEGQMHQVLINLALNARDAMPNGGRLTITSSNADLQEGDAPPFPEMVPGLYVLLTISDTGVGMSPEVRAHLFEPFFTTKEQGKGTGLGLSTVYGIIQQSGGRIVVETEPGKGTIFKIFLPAIVPPAEPSAGARTASAVHGGTETIVVVEDHNEVRELAVKILRDYGYNVLEAADATEALRMIEHHKGSIHLILTDVVMPGMAGPELLERVRSTHPTIKTLLMSGYVDSNAAEQSVSELGLAYIQKPFTPEVLAAKIREVLDKG